VAANGSAASTVVVDCSGATPGAFTSVNAAINSLTAPPDVTDWHYVLLRSDCTENVVITGARRVWIAPDGAQCPFAGCPVGPRFTITGATAGKDVVQVSGPAAVTLVRLAITGGGNGLSVLDGGSVTLYDVTADDNAGTGMFLNGGASLILHESTARRNGGNGLSLGIGSRATLTGQMPWLRNQPVEFRDNAAAGIWLDRSVLGGYAGIIVDGNARWGIVSYGGDLLWGAYTGETTVQNNANGVFLSEGTQASIWRSQTGVTTIRNNGGFGLYVAKGSQAFVAANLIEGHTVVGVDTVMGSQLSLLGTQVSGNGAGPSGVAGIRVDANSQADLEDAQVTGNTGPGLIVDFNSSLDARGTSVTGNSAEGVRVRHRSIVNLAAGGDVGSNVGPPVSCDDTSEVVSPSLAQTRACANVTRPTQPRPVRPPDP
jgi:hypothetical protein